MLEVKENFPIFVLDIRLQEIVDYQPKNDLDKYIPYGTVTFKMIDGHIVMSVSPSGVEPQFDYINFYNAETAKKVAHLHDKLSICDFNLYEDGDITVETYIMSLPHMKNYPYIRNIKLSFDVEYNTQENSNNKKLSFFGYDFNIDSVKSKDHSYDYSMADCLYNVESLSTLPSLQDVNSYKLYVPYTLTLSA